MDMLYISVESSCTFQNRQRFILNI